MLVAQREKSALALRTYGEDELLERVLAVGDEDLTHLGLAAVDVLALIHRSGRAFRPAEVVK